MLQRDYFLRMTEMLSAVLAKILFNKEIKNYEEAESEIESASKTITGLDLKIISILNTEDIVQLMKTSDLYAGKCLICAKLLKEYGDIHELNGKKNESSDNYIKSLRLYTEALCAKELTSPENYYLEINELAEKLNYLNLSNELNLKLTEYYEISGQFSRAEDLYFELLEKNENDFLEKAVSYYKRLRNKSEAELNSGNLSSEEVEESLEEILNRKKII